MIRRFAVLVAAALVGLSVPAAAAGARALPNLVCDQFGVASPTTSSRLRQDLTCELSIGRGISVVVDLAGHNLIGDVEVGEGASLTLENGQVTGSVHGQGSVLTLSGVRVTGDVGSIKIGLTTVNLKMRASEVDGLLFISGSMDVSRSVLRGGISTLDTETGVNASITHNLILDSPGPGIAVEADWSVPDVVVTVTDNVIIGSVSDGITMAVVSSLRTVDVSRNLLINNGGDGIHIGGTDPSVDDSVPPAVTIKGNRTVGNGGHGINVEHDPALPGAIVDGGHNTAIDNKTEPQCVGVVCKR